MKAANEILGDVCQRSRAAGAGTCARAKDGCLGPAGAAKRGEWVSVSKIAPWQGNA